MISLRMIVKLSVIGMVEVFICSLIYDGSLVLMCWVMVVDLIVLMRSLRFILSVEISVFLSSSGVIRCCFEVLIVVCMMNLCLCVSVCVSSRFEVLIVLMMSRSM